MYKVQAVPTREVRNIENKTITSKVGAISKAQKAQFFKYAQDVFMESFENSFETPNGGLSCSIRLGKKYFKKDFVFF